MTRQIFARNALLAGEVWALLIAGSSGYGNYRCVPCKHFRCASAFAQICQTYFIQTSGDMWSSCFPGTRPTWLTPFRRGSCLPGESYGLTNLE